MVAKDIKLPNYCCDVIFCMLTKKIISRFLEFFKEASTFFDKKWSKSLETLEKPLEMPDYVFCLQNK